ncbi:MAG: RecX family transcriptional regulator [Treponema sp.]|jgi:regulatory protein|nr:RecX family transcriptional regulator [Treponema sp.]
MNSPFELASGREISADEERALRFVSACLKAEKAALALTANAEQTVYGLSHKLTARGYTENCVKPVVAHLIDLGVVNDERYARFWLEARLFSKTDSPRKLFASLRNKGIERKTAERAFKTVLDFEQEQTLLKKYLKKLEKTGKPIERRLLKQEGFSYEAIEAELER